MADVLETAVDGREVAERAVGEEVDEEGEEEEEEEEEEPVLKYNRFNKELVKRLGPQTSEDDHPPQGPVELISCVAVHSKASIPCSCMFDSAELAMDYEPQYYLSTRANMP